MAREKEREHSMANVWNYSRLNTNDSQEIHSCLEGFRAAET